MAAERNFFHRWRGMTTIGYELGVIWEMSVKGLAETTDNLERKVGNEVMKAYLVG